MNIDFTRPTLFRAILYFLLLYLFFRGREWLAMEAVPADYFPTMPLQQWLTDFCSGHPVWKEIYLFLLTLLSAFSLTRILSRSMIYLERTFLPAIVFPLVALGYYSSGTTPVTITVAFLLTFAVNNMIKSHKREENFGYFLNAAVALGLAVLLYAPAAVFLLLLPVGFVLFRQNWRSIVTAVFGYFLPLLFCSYILWGMGENFGDTTRRIFSVITTPSFGTFFIFRMEGWDYVLAGIYLLLLLLAVIGFSKGQTQPRRRALRGFSIFFWALVVSLGMTALPGRSLDMLPVLAVPMAALIPAVFNRKSGWLPNLLYLLMIWSVIIYNLRFYIPIFQS